MGRLRTLILARFGGKLATVVATSGLSYSLRVPVDLVMFFDGKLLVSFQEELSTLKIVIDLLVLRVQIITLGGVHGAARDLLRVVELVCVQAADHRR